MKKINLKGRRFGRLKVLRETQPRNGRKEPFWRCICSCGSGRVKDFRGSTLRSGNARGCGCLNHIRLRPFESLYRRLLRDAEHARKRPIQVKLTYREFLTFTGRRCFYCWAEIEWKKFKGGCGYHLDRMNSAQGYSKENCVACCTRCNRGKSDLFTFSEWRRMTSIFRRK